mgnify:FL=1
MFKFLAELEEEGTLICCISNDLRDAVNISCEYEVDWSFMMAVSMHDMNEWLKFHATQTGIIGTITYRKQRVIGVAIRNFAFKHMRLPLQKVFHGLMKNGHVTLARMFYRIDQTIYKITFAML